jgi:hypothetical protein
MHDCTDAAEPRQTYEPPKAIALGAVTTKTLGHGGSSSHGGHTKPSFPWFPKFPSGPRGRH